MLLPDVENRLCNSTLCGAETLHILFSVGMPCIPWHQTHSKLHRCLWKDLWIVTLPLFFSADFSPVQHMFCSHLHGKRYQTKLAHESMPPPPSMVILHCFIDLLWGKGTLLPLKKPVYVPGSQASRWRVTCLWVSGELVKEGSWDPLQSERSEPLMQREPRMGIGRSKARHCSHMWKF